MSNQPHPFLQGFSTKNGMPKSGNVAAVYLSCLGQQRMRLIILNKILEFAETKLKIKENNTRQKQLKKITITAVQICLIIQ